METCKTCGAVIPDGATFCPNCGNTLAPTEAYQPQQPAFEQPSQPYAQPQQPAFEQPAQPYVQPQQPYNQNPYGTQPNVSTGPMPNKGLHTALLVIGFVCGILWGLLALSPYKKMNAAIEANNSVEANAQAKKVRTFAIIGIVINVLFLIGQIASNM